MPRSGSGSDSAANDAAALVVRELQMRVEALEAEIEALSSSRAPLRRDDPCSSTTSILCDDLLLDIFLRLPSVATLIRAACVCSAWRRAVASSPDFRRRFRALHPPPLLGIFTDAAASIIAGSPTFVPARRHDDDDLAAAVRGGDFLLTSLPDAGWQVINNTCRLGNLLLYNHEDKSFATINPLTRQPNQRRRVPDLGSRNMLGGGYFVGVLLSSTRLMLVDHAHAGSKMKATIYSMDAWEVCSAATPWVDVPACPDNGGHVLYGMAMHLDGSVYCVLSNWGCIVSIDTATMEFTAIELPPQCVSRQSLAVGETRDGATCLVYSDGLDIGVLMHTRDGIQKLVLDRLVSMDAELQRVLPAGQFDVLQVFAVKDGYVYLSASSQQALQDPPGNNRYWFLSLCLATMKLEKLFQVTYGCNGIPYFMPWPRSLFGW